MTNEKPPAPEEVKTYLFNLARARKDVLHHLIEHGNSVLKGRREQQLECEAALVALERETFVLAKWIQDQ